MRNILATTCLLGLLATSLASAARVEESKSWTRTFAVTGTAPTLEIHNIWGDVRVRKGKAGEISVSVSERHSASDQARLEHSMQIFSLSIEADEDGLAMEVGDHDRGWSRAKRCKGCRAEYDFDVVVPADTKLHVNTVNDGQVEVTGVAGVVSAGNVNGPVSVSGLSNCTTLESVNGEVTASFTRQPVENCDIETVNGDITIRIPGKSGLNVAMDLFNGRMYSDLPVDSLAIPARVMKRPSGDGFSYRIEQPAGVSIAGGGPTFSISSINGDIRIQKIQ